MQGLRWLMLGSDGKPANHGEILKEILATKYLCHFAATPSYSRVVDIAEIQRWLLFPDDNRMNAFILALRRQELAAAVAAKPPPTEPPQEYDPDPKPPAKKKTKKKAAKKKTVKKGKSNG